MPETRTVTRTAAPAASRPLDAVYDPNYYVSTATDHARTLQRTHRLPTGATTTMPSAENMFSELQHHPRATQHAGPPPAADVPHNGPQIMERMAMAARDYNAAEPQGRDLLRFLNSSFLPMPTSGGFNTALLKLDMQAGPGLSAPIELPPGSMVTVATQTDYRESETQTDPYTPDYVVRPGSAPEVLTLATLAHGVGLPAGLAEVEMIERARARRAWEATLPPVEDASRAIERSRAIEARELEELKFREEEIQRVQDERLQVLEQLIVELESNKQQDREDKLNRHYQQRQIERNRMLARSERQAVKDIRKLTKARQNIEGNLKRRDIVEQYSNPASEEFAPTRTLGGGVHDQHANRYRVDSKHVSSYQGLLDLEASLPKSVTTPRARAAKGTNTSATGRRGGMASASRRRMQDTLRQLDETMSMARTGTLPILPPIRCVERIEKAKQRPPTPEVEDEGDEARAARRAIVLLQSILRGRAMQNEMYEQKEQRRDLIEELRSTHALQAAQQAVKEKEREQLQARREADARETRRQATITAAVNATQSAHLGNTLDFLSKELVRLQEEHRIHAFAVMAERERRMREAEEAGQRQAEEHRRAQGDEIFRQMMQVHNGTVDSYLESILLAAQEDVADEQAREFVREQARRIDAAAAEAHASGYDETDLGAQAIASELVTSFLLPEVEREALRGSLQREQRKLLQGAHEAVFAKTQEVEGQRRWTGSRAATASGSRPRTASAQTQSRPHTTPAIAEHTGLEEDNN